MFAVIETGGKQYLVSPKDKIKVEHLNVEEGKEVGFDKVLLVSNKEVEIGKPYIKGTQVLGKVLKHGRAKKIKIFKYKSKIRYRKRQGHRQQYTEVEITKIA